MSESLTTQTPKHKYRANTSFETRGNFPLKHLPVSLLYKDRHLLINQVAGVVIIKKHYDSVKRGSSLSQSLLPRRWHSSTPDTIPRQSQGPSEMLPCMYQ